MAFSANILYFGVSWACVTRVTCKWQRHDNGKNMIDGDRKLMNRISSCNGLKCAIQQTQAYSLNVKEYITQFAKDLTTTCTATNR